MATYRKVQNKADIKSTLSTRSYKVSHLKAPKGAGFWSFDVTYSTFNVQSTEQVCFHGSYAQAVKQVVDHVQPKLSKSCQVICINVLP